MAQGPFLRKYGVETTIDFHLFEVDGVDFRVDAAHAAGDSVIMKDEGAEANTSNGFTDEGTGYSIVLTATEMQAARIVVYVIDQTATKVWLDTALVVETYGNASAMHAFDLDTATQDVNAVQISGDSTAADNLETACDNYSATRGLAGTALPAAAAQAVGGLYTRGSGAGQIAQTNNGRIDSDAKNVEIVGPGAISSLSFQASSIVAGAIAANALDDKGNWLQPTVAGRTLDITAGGAAGIDWGNVENKATANDLSGTDIQLCDTVTTLTGHTVQTGDSFARLGAPAGASVSADMAAVKGDTAATLVDTNELQGDWANGGRLDLILDARASQTTADAIETDTQDIQSRLPAALISGRMNSDVEAINDDTDAADKLAAHALETLPVTFSAGGSTTTAVLNQVDGAGASGADDVYNGRILVFNNGTLNHQVAEITDYDGGTTTATISAVTTAPGATHTARMI